MGIRTFTFNGESSDTYGILINKNASFNAPERAGEMLSIPGRNGAFWQDYGRFENIEVTYHCAVGEGSKADFVDAMSDVRSWLCSPIGYCRLEDDYNPNEYRMAVYKSGLETDEPFLTGAEFDIVFECKPQRYLKSGETAISVTSGDTITNPTRFDAQPLLEVWGYGTIDIGNGSIEINDTTIGTVVVASTATRTGKVVFGASSKYGTILSTSALNTGDGILIEGETVGVSIQYPSSVVANVAVASVTNCTATVNQGGTNTWDVLFLLNNITFFKGTSATVNVSCQVSAEIDGTTRTYTFSRILEYDGDSYIDQSMGSSGNTTGSPTGNYQINTPQIIGGSTKSLPSHPMYIDLDLGEAWNEDYGEPLPLNSVVQLPADLPSLSVGATEITYDNTVTQLDIVPRWWQV